MSAAPAPFVTTRLGTAGFSVVLLVGEVRPRVAQAMLMRTYTVSNGKAGRGSPVTYVVRASDRSMGGPACEAHDTWMDWLAGQ